MLSGDVARKRSGERCGVIEMRGTETNRAILMPERHETPMVFNLLKI